MNEIQQQVFVRALMADTAAATRSFAVGQQWSGRVLQALAGERFIITLGDLRLLAESPLPLEAGQRITVEVVRTGDQVELRLRSPDAARTSAPTLRLLAGPPSAAETLQGDDAARAAIVERNYDAASLRAALDGSEAERWPAPEAAGRAAVIVREEASGRLQPRDAEALLRILQPHAPETAADTAAALRAWLRDGGFLFEAHLRALLAGSPPATADEALAALRADLKTLLGRVGATSAEPAASTGAQPGAERAAGPPDRQVATQAPAPHAILAERLIGEQVRLAHRWINDGVLSFELPLRLPGGETRALVEFESEGEGPAVEPGARPGCRVFVHIDSAIFGAVQATANWRGGECKTSFFVERPLARECLAADLESLKAGLGAFFERVAVDVVVDEVRARRPLTAIRVEPPPGGGIVSTRA